MYQLLSLLLVTTLLFAQDTPPDTVTIIAVGDIMVASKGTARLDQHGVAYGLDSLREELAKADIRFANQESPIGTDRSQRFDKKYTFLTPPRHGEVLVDGGFEVVTLANNHGMDYGMVAMKQTFEWLSNKGIKWVGAGVDLKDSRKPAIIEKNGVKYGFLGYSNTYPQEFWSTPSKGGNPFGHASYLKKDIPALRAQVDYLFVSFHWGAELMKGTKQYQKDLARLAIDLGADGVFGSHPHILQGVEYYKEKPIAYSLGNFLFASWSNKVWDSAILKVRFAGGKFLGAEIVPILVNNFAVELQPRLLRGAEADSSLTMLAEQSSVWGTELRIDNGRGYFGPTTPQIIEPHSTDSLPLDSTEADSLQTTASDSTSTLDSTITPIQNQDSTTNSKSSINDSLTVKAPVVDSAQSDSANTDSLHVDSVSTEQSLEESSKQEPVPEDSKRKRRRKKRKEK